MEWYDTWGGTPGDAPTDAHDRPGRIVVGMAAPDAPDVDRLGGRLRQERERRGVSVRGLARDVGISASMVSQIETGKSQPSVSTLYAITTALGITVEELFAPAPDGNAGEVAPPPTTKEAEQARPVAAAAGPELLRGAPLGPVVRPSQRRVLRLDSGVTWELLGDLPQHTVDFLLVTYEPGGASSSLGGLMRHPGSEFGHLLSGELVLTLGFEEMIIRAGDSICFDSTTPHRYRNDQDVPAVGVWFVIERDR
jgi:transcriptional regulator with XRE-family HTH domain